MIPKSSDVVRRALTAMACACAIGAAALAPSPVVARQEQLSIAEIGADWQKRGLLSQSEYIELRRVTAAVQKSGLNDQ